jgi:SAM-dependent methyltransferase
MKTTKDYLEMQLTEYDKEATKWSLQDKNPVVGWYDNHNMNPDYDNLLFKGFDTSDKVAIEYGCGPGRNQIKFADRFKRVDGCDISPICIEKAKINIEDAGLELPKLYVCDGKSLPVPDGSYDVVFSVICLQHICVHSIRYSIMSDIFRVLKPGGYFCAQMGFGVGDSPNTVGYYDDYTDAIQTNGWRDTRIDDEAFLKDDLDKIGFIDYRSDIVKADPRDQHPNWIWFQGRKP